MRSLSRSIVDPVIAALLAGIAQAAPFKYVPNAYTNNVSLIDTATNAVIATLPVGSHPVGVAVNAAGTRVYVNNVDADSVSVIDALTFTVGATIPVGAYPAGIAVNPTGTRVSVANGDANSVSVIDSTTNTVVTTVRVRGSPLAFGQFIGPAIPGPSTSPVCRYCIPPGLGDSHFFGRGTVERNATRQKKPSFVLEDSAFVHMFLPVQGACPVNTTQVYRVFSNRSDADHRYITDRVVRDQMVAKGWLAEHDGPGLVVMCAPP
jgi:YVTN family beta-propeller protein